MTTRLQPGDIAPDFTLPTDTGETVTLSDLLVLIRTGAASSSTSFPPP